MDELSGAILGLAVALLGPLLVARWGLGIFRQAVR